MTASLQFDLLGLGYACIDELLFVDAYPQPDAKAHVRRRITSVGGLTAAALIAASRDGARCAYAGVLGDDDGSQFILDVLAAENIDTTLVRRRSGARALRATVIVASAEQTRTILLDREGLALITAAEVTAESIGRTRLLFVDHSAPAAMLRAAQLAQAREIPIIADFERRREPEIEDLVRLVDHLILPAAFAVEWTGCDRPTEAVEQLWHAARETVVVTCGAAGGWYRGAGMAGSRPFTAYPTTVADTTGCGDVFHGVYAAALAAGLDLDRRIRRAAAAAALQAAAADGHRSIPRRQQIDAVLED